MPVHCTKNEVSIKDLFSKCDQIHRKLRIWSHLLEKLLMENFIFCAVVFRKTITDQRKNVISVQLERLLTGIAFYETG